MKRRAFGGIGFTMSLFIAAYAYPAQFSAAKAAIFGASLIAAVLGVAILVPPRSTT